MYLITVAYLFDFAFNENETLETKEKKKYQCSVVLNRCLAQMRFKDDQFLSQ